MPARLRSALRHMFTSPGRQVSAISMQHRQGRSKAILYRILGPDQPGITAAQATQQQLEFILKHEVDHPGMERRWLLNRIAESEVRDALVSLLDNHRQIWDELPFDGGVYASCWTDIGAVPRELHPWHSRFAQIDSGEQAQVLDYVGRHKSTYLLNTNSARNHALIEGWRDADWVFAWDASCFLTAEAWQVILPLLDLPSLAYIAVPSASLTDSQELLKGINQPPLADGLPLLGMARRASAPYNPDRRTTCGSSTDLACRLGLTGSWRESQAESCAWESFDTTLLPDRAKLVQAGWAYRLPPGPIHDLQQRRHAIRLYARKADMRLIGDALKRYPLRCWTSLEPADALTPGLASIAANARSVSPLSVTDKPEALPGSAERSYVNAVPHWQSLAGHESALSRTGLLGSAGPLCGDVAQHYDRARLQLMIDCVCALALDGQLNGNQASRDHAVRMLRAWFIDPATAMIPDGAYARLSAVDHSRNVLDAAIDFRDLYPLLDAISLLQRCGCFSLAERQQIEEWFDAFLAWLAADSSTYLQQHSSSPACTWYHLLMLAIAAYLGRKNVAAQALDNLPGLLAHQFRSDGSPVSCSPDSSLRHEHLFNLQAWTNLVVLSSTLGRDLLSFTDSNGIGLRCVFAHAQRHLPEADQVDGDGGLTPGQWFQIMKALASLDAPVALLPEGLPPLAEVNSGLPPSGAFAGRFLELDGAT